MTSDFSAARIHLERAGHYLRGGDQISQKVCDALDLLLEADATAEYFRSRGEVVEFRGWKKSESKQITTRRVFSICPHRNRPAPSREWGAVRRRPCSESPRFNVAD